MSARLQSRLLTPAMLLVLLLIFGCARRSPNFPTEGTIQSSPTPFQGQATNSTATSGRGFSAGEAQGTVPPFQNSADIPAGSLLTVRLKVPLIAVSGSQESFEAVLDEPVLVDGNILIPRDAIVSGEVESAHVSNTKPDRGYVRLTLNSVQVDGVAVPIQTASLFARQPSGTDADPVTIRLESGRRLTFRLKEQVFLRPNVPKAANNPLYFLHFPAS